MTIYVTNPDYTLMYSNPELLKNAVEHRFDRNRSVFVDEIMFLLKQNPVISSAAASSLFPFGDSSMFMPLRPQNGAVGGPLAQVNHVTGDFFEVAGVPLIIMRTNPSELLKRG